MQLIRSFFFAPANRPDLAAKFQRYDADCYVLDLEDGTPEGERAQARADLPGLVRAVRRSALSGLLYVRTNEPGSPQLAQDLAAVAACAPEIDGIVVPKLGTAGDLPALAAALAPAETGRRAPLPIIGGIESMEGVINVHEIARAGTRLAGLYFGAEDFASDLGARRTRGGAEVLYARSRTVLATRAARLAAIDQAVIDIRDDDLFRSDGEAGRDLGYTGKICLLPRQTAIANEVFSPSEREVTHARALITAYEAAMADGRGTIDFEGAMVDGPLLKRAQALVALSERLRARQAPRQAG